MQEFTMVYKHTHSKHIREQPYSGISRELNKPVSNQVHHIHVINHGGQTNVGVSCFIFVYHNI